MNEGITLQGRFLTDREKAAIRLHVFGEFNDWRLLFEMAGGHTTSERSRATFISRWKTSAKVQAEIEALKREKYARDQATKEELRAEIESENEKGDDSGERSRIKKAPVDYFDPVNQKAMLNELINTTKDPDEKLDALKIITATQRDDRQAAKEGRQVRAFLPLNCRDCPLYQKAAKH